jgi:primosomal protein N'
MSTEAPSLAAALAAVQRKLPDVRKAETAHVRSDKGNYSYRYATLPDITKAVLPLLGENGLAWITRPTLVDDRFVLVYELLHTSGEKVSGEYPLPTGGSPQALGSAITYARRYCLCAVTGVAADDDDDGAAATAQHHNRGPEYDANDPAAIKKWARDEQARKSVVGKAEGAIQAAETTEALDVVAKRITQVEKQGLITSEDAVALRQKLVLKHDDINGTAKQEDPE